jgi:hypothetical protein
MTRTPPVLGPCDSETTPVLVPQDPATANPQAVRGARDPRSGNVVTSSQPPRGGVATPSPSPAESLPAGEAPLSSLTDFPSPSIRRGAARTQTPAAADGPAPRTAAAGPAPAVASVSQAAAEQTPARGVRGADGAPLAGSSGAEWRAKATAAISAQNAAKARGRSRYTRVADRPVGGRYVPGGNRKAAPRSGEGDPR